MIKIYQVVDNKTNDVYLITNFSISINTPIENCLRKIIDETNTTIDEYKVSIRIKIFNIKEK